MRIPDSILDTVRRAALAAVVVTAGAAGASELIATDPVTGATTATTPAPTPTATPEPIGTVIASPTPAPILFRPPVHPYPRPRPVRRPNFDPCPPCGMG